MKKTGEVLAVHHVCDILWQHPRVLDMQVAGDPVGSSRSLLRKGLPKDQHQTIDDIARFLFTSYVRSGYLLQCDTVSACPSYLRTAVLQISPPQVVCISGHNIVIDQTGKQQVWVIPITSIYQPWSMVKLLCGINYFLPFANHQLFNLPSSLIPELCQPTNISVISLISPYLIFLQPLWNH